MCKFLKNPHLNPVKIFWANSVFQGKRKLFKILKDKTYIQHSEFRTHSVFQGKQMLLKHPECKKYIKYSEKFHDKLCYIQDVWATFACPEKQSVSWIHCIECIFYPSEFWTTCACPEKQSLPLIFSLHWITIFEELALVLKTKFFLKYFTVLNIVFTLRIFEQLVLALKKRVCREFTVLNIYFFIIQNFKQPALALKNRICPESFLLYWNIFYLPSFLSSLSLSWKQSLFWICQAGGAAARPPHLVGHCTHLLTFSEREKSY